MQEFTISKQEANQRLDRWLSKTLPLLPAPLANKYLRLKRVKCNGKAAKGDVRLSVGDFLQLYINDEFFQRPTPENAFLSIHKPQVDIVYEDEHLLLVNKRPGLVVHTDETEGINTLINHIQAYLYQSKAWNPNDSFTPALCNRIDRNTGGIVIAAKSAEALRIMNEKIRDREVEKSYLCIIAGAIQPPSGRLEGFLLRDETSKQVSIYSHPIPGGKTALTEYVTLAVSGELSLMECLLHTGRTHQIRAQFAHAGHPLLGDGKYGRARFNRQYGRTQQALSSYKIRFAFSGASGCLSHLQGKEFRLSSVDFVEEFFPNYKG